MPLATTHRRASQLLRPLAALTLVLGIAAATTSGQDPARADAAGPPSTLAQSVSTHSVSAGSVSTQSTITQCRGSHLHGYVVIRHIITADCLPPGTYYSYNANVWSLPADNMVTCNGDNNHGDPPAPYVVVALGKSNNCLSYTQVVEKVTTYTIKLPYEGLGVCDAQRQLPAGWVVARRDFTFACRNPHLTGFPDNTMFITRG